MFIQWTDAYKLGIPTVDAQHKGLADLVNRYRVQALKQALSDPQQAAQSILDLALAAGFNSKSAFNRVFKKQTGMTPGAYRKQSLPAA